MREEREWQIIPFDSIIRYQLIGLWYGAQAIIFHSNIPLMIFMNSFSLKIGEVRGIPGLEVSVE